MKVYDQLTKRDKVIFHGSIWVFIIIFSYLFDENSESVINTILAMLMTVLFTIELVFIIRYFMKKSKEKQVKPQNKTYSNPIDSDFIDFSHYGDPEVVQGKWVRKFRFKRDFKLSDAADLSQLEYKLHYVIKDDKIFFSANPDKEKEFMIEVSDPEVADRIREFSKEDDIDIHIGFINVNRKERIAKIKIAFYRGIDIETNEFVKKIEAKLVKTTKHDDGESRQDHILDVDEGDYVYLEDDDAAEGFVIINESGYTIGELSKRDINKMDDYIDSWPSVIKVSEVIYDDNDNISLLLTFNFIDPRFDRK